MMCGMSTDFCARNACGPMECAMARMRLEPPEPAREDVYMQTASGVMFNLSCPRAVDVDVTTIGWHLSRLCRYTGALRDPDWFYPVSEHLVLGIQPALDAGGRRLACYWFAHDFAEAYTGDISRPMKELIGLDRMREIEDRINAVIAQALGLEWTDEIHRAVKVIDKRMLNTERRDLLGNGQWSKHYLAMPYAFTVRPVFDIRDARLRFEAAARVLGFLDARRGR